MWQSALYVRCPFCGSISNKKLESHNRSIRKCQCGKVFYWDAVELPENMVKEENLELDKSIESNRNIEPERKNYWQKFIDWFDLSK